MMLVAAPAARSGDGTRLRVHAPGLPASAVALLREARPSLLNATAAIAVPRAYADQGVVELYHLRFERVDRFGLSWQVIQRVFDVRTAEGASIFGVDDLWYDGSRNRFALWKAQIIRNGKVVAEGQDGGDSIPGATGNRSRRLNLPPLHPGDRVNLVYVLTPAHEQRWKHLGDHYLGDLFAFRGPYPVMKVKYELRSARRLAVSQEKLPAPTVLHQDGEWSWSWAGGPYPAFFSELAGPSITDRSPFVQVSGFDTWPELVAWYQQELNRRAQMSAAFRRRLLKLAPPQATPLQTVQAVWGYLSQHLEYHGVEEGVHAYLPSPVETVLKAGKGDCKDGSLLLVTWLRAEGVPAYLALVRTRPMGRVAPGAATMAAFDHAIVAVPSLGLWIDTTAPDFRVPEVPSSDQDGLALVVRPGASGLTRIPIAAADENVTRRTVRLRSRGDGWYDADGEIDVRGADAPALRRSYWKRSGKAQRAELDDWLRSAFPHARVEQLSVRGIRRSRQWIHLRFRARLHPGKVISVAWTPRHYARILAAEAHRSDALQLPLRWTTEETWELDGKAAASCPRQLKPVREQSQFGSVEVHASCQPGRLVVHSRVVQSSEQVAPSEYNNFRRFWRNADALLNGNVWKLPEQNRDVDEAAASPLSGAQTAGTVSLVSSSGKETPR